MKILFLLILNISAYASNQVPIFFGKWKVVSTGSECVTTGWIETIFEPQFGRVVGQTLNIQANHLGFGKVECRSVTYSFFKEPLVFFDGNACHENLGKLPAQCEQLMKNQKGGLADHLEASCKGSNLIPSQYVILSKDYLLASIDGDYLCLKRDD